MSEDAKTTWSGEWELVETGGGLQQQFRQRVPGGWLVMCMMADTSSMTFLPDPAHEWSPPLKQGRKRGFNA